MTRSKMPIRIGRGHKVALTVVIAFAFGGLFLGMRPMPRPAQGRAGAQAEAPSEAAPPGVPYLRLGEHRAANRAVTTDFGRLRDGLPPLGAPVERDPDALRAALAARASRRAFEGAPPVIPHAIDERSSAACLTCHARGVRINGRTAPAISHEPYASCTQCHAPSLPRAGRELPAFLDNGFAGLSPTARGPRAWPGAPPAIPHTTWMRSACGSCHGVTGADGIRTTHPERASCTQCHAPVSSEPPGS